MLTILVLMVGAVMVLVLVLFAVVVVGIKQEPPAEELRRHPPNVVTRGSGACSACMSASQTSPRSPVVVLRYLFDPGWCAVSW